MSDGSIVQQKDGRTALARFLMAALNHFREDAEAAGLVATAKALDAAVCAINVEVPTATRC